MSTATTPAADNSAAQVILSVKDLDVDFTTEMGTVEALRGVNFEVRRGESIAIVGESGSGKTTAINAVLGLLPGNGRVVGGSINFQGKDLAKVSESEFQKLRGAHMALVPQDPMSNLNPVLTIGDQVGEVLLTHHKATKSTVDAKVISILGDAGLGDSSDRLKQYPHQFSGGMRQRVLIGIGLSCDPELLIADEPTSALDVTVQKQILDHLDHLTQTRDTSTLFITHDLGLAAERSEKIIVMYRGRIVEQGASKDIIQNPQHEYTKRLINAAPSVNTERDDPAERDGFYAAVEEGRDTLNSDVVLSARNLTQVFKIRQGSSGKRVNFTAVDNISFDLKRGQTLAIVGESGSGKSTTARMVLRLDDPASGEIEFHGKNIAAIKGRELKTLRKRLQPIFQDPYSSINPMSSIGQVLEEPLKVHGIGTKATRKAKALELLDQVSLAPEMYDRYSAELSGGQRQRIAIARALALEPEVIICDEPVSALDVIVQAQILDLLEKLQRELGLSYLFISHDLAVVRQIADRVIVMQKGKMVEEGDSEELFQNPQEEYTKNLLNSIPGMHLI